MGISSVFTVFAGPGSENREMEKLVKLGWMQVDVIGKDEKVERERRIFCQM